ncbi:MAG TPA: ABC transporter permease subunit [Dehalococcoidia bacterium]|nr:ABC transporter permease subunit [Dehalococcoidia bacterium]
MRAEIARQQALPVWLASPAIGSLFILLAGVGVWQAASTHRLIASPRGAVEELYNGFADDSLLTHLTWSLQATMQGLGYAIVIGIALGLLFGLIRPLRRVFSELVYGFASVPKLVIYPILLVSLKIGMRSEIAFVAVAAVFPILINTMVGAQEVQPALIKVGRVFKASFWQMIFKVFLPSVTPALIAGLRLGYSLGVLHAVLAEMFVARKGLGTQLIHAYSVQDISRMYAIILLAFLLAVVGNILLWFVERKLRGCLA